MKTLDYERACREWISYCRAHFDDWYVRETLELWRASKNPALRRVGNEALPCG